MDLYCERCGEPWEHYYVLHEMTPEERNHFLHGEGCPSCYGKKPCTREYDCEECLEYDHSSFRCRANEDKRLVKRPFRAELSAALHSVLGDDTDGLAAEMEDAEALLGSEFWE